jgi:hypothetical protein
VDVSQREREGMLGLPWIKAGLAGITAKWSMFLDTGLSIKAAKDWWMGTKRGVDRKVRSVTKST